MIKKFIISEVDKRLNMLRDEGKVWNWGPSSVIAMIKGLSDLPSTWLPSSLNSVQEPIEMLSQDVAGFLSQSFISAMRTSPSLLGNGISNALFYIHPAFDSKYCAKDVGDVSFIQKISLKPIEMNAVLKIQHNFFLEVRGDSVCPPMMPVAFGLKTVIQLDNSDKKISEDETIFLYSDCPYQKVSKTMIYRFPEMTVYGEDIDSCESLRYRTIVGDKDGDNGSIMRCTIQTAFHNNTEKALSNENFNKNLLMAVLK